MYDTQLIITRPRRDHIGLESNDCKLLSILKRNLQSSQSIENGVYKRFDYCLALYMTVLSHILTNSNQKICQLPQTSTYSVFTPNL